VDLRKELVLQRILSANTDAVHWTSLSDDLLVMAYGTASGLPFDVSCVDDFD
jgi:hypothetical protein